MALNPGYLGEVLADIKDRKTAGRGIALMQRRQDLTRPFGSELEMMLAGAAMFPESRELVTDRLTEFWGRSRILATNNRDEIIIGAGFHAAVYCLNRVLAGYPPPVVLERADAARVGGCWAWSMEPVFRLNSRNRPDFNGQGTPDQDGALNFIPGSPLQPSMMSSEEYASNDLIGWLTRALLALCARVRPGVTVRSVNPPATTLRLSTDQTLTAGRILDARGLGDPKGAELADGKTVLTFPQWMEKMGGDFPLKGLNQVAVVGGGNSGACAAESALGIGPGHTSVAGLDWVRAVDWYTGGSIAGDCNSIRDMSRGRYIALAQQVAGNTSNRVPRLRVLGNRATAVPLADGAFCAGRTYDAAVLCTGFTLEPLCEELFTLYPTDTVPLAASCLGCWKIGPAANIPFLSEGGSAVTSNPANRVAMFRLAPRTAALARMLKGL